MTSFEICVNPDPVCEFRAVFVGGALLQHSCPEPSEGCYVVHKEEDPPSVHNSFSFCDKHAQALAEDLCSERYVPILEVGRDGSLYVFPLFRLAS